MRNRSLFLALAITGFFLSMTALSLVTIDRLKYYYLAPHQQGFVGVALTSLAPTDVFLLGLVAVISMAIPIIGLRTRGLMRLLAGEDPALLWLVTAATLVWMGHAITAPGLIVTGDAGTHVARISHLSMALRDGGSLYWDNYFFGGSTLLQFTGPMFHWFASVVTLVVGSATVAAKICVSLARTLAALFCYLLVRKLGVGRAAACIATVFYAGAFQMTYMEIVRSSFPQLVNYAAMPAILYCTECLLARPVVFGPATAGLGLSAICLIGSHQPTALLFALFVAMIVASHIATDRQGLAATPALATAAGVVSLGSSFFLLPFALERGMTADNFTTSSLIGTAMPSLGTLRTFVLWDSAGEGAEYATYFGIPMLLCVAVGGLLSLRRDPGQVGIRRTWRLFFSFALMSLFLRGAYVRTTTFTFLFLCIAGAAGADMLIRLAWRHTSVPALIFLAVVLDAGPAAIQPWTRTDMQTVAAAGESLARRAPDGRVMEVWFAEGRPRVTVGPVETPLGYSRVQMLSGPHKQDATPAHNAFAAILKVGEHDLIALQAFSEPTRSLLAMANIGWIVGNRGAVMGLPETFHNTIPDPVLGAYWRIPEATPFVVSGHLEQMDRPAAFYTGPLWDQPFERDLPDSQAVIAAVKEIHARMEADPAARQARTLLLPVIPRSRDWQTDTPDPPFAHLITYVVEPGRVRLTMTSDRDGFIRLAHPLAETVSVSRDGESIAAMPDVESLVILPIHAGTNEIDVTTKPSRLRQACFWITCTTIIGLLLWLGCGAWKGRRLGMLGRQCSRVVDGRLTAG